jgi:ribosomal protein L30E
MSLDELKLAIKEHKLTYGTRETLKKLKNSEVNVVFLASNTPSEVKETVVHYAGLSGAKIVGLDIPDEEVGVICKKRHSVSVLSY